MNDKPTSRPERGIPDGNHPIFRELAAKSRPYAALAGGDEHTHATTVTSDQSVEATGVIHPPKLPAGPGLSAEPLALGSGPLMAGEAEVADVARLVVENGSDAGRAHDVEGTTYVGRSRSADIRLADSAIGARHLELRFCAGSWRVRDLGSCNGTRLNGQPVYDAEIQSGDRLTLGTSTLRFEAGELAETVDKEKVALGKGAPLGLPLQPLPRGEATLAVELPPVLPRQQPPIATLPRHISAPPPTPPRGRLDWTGEDTGLSMSPEVRRALRLVLWSFLFSTGLVAAAILIRVLR